MKKFRVLFQLFAFALAIGSAFAFTSRTDIQGYKKLSQAPWCQTSVMCNNEGDVACKDGVDNVFDGSQISSTSCGVQLTHRP